MAFPRSKHQHFENTEKLDFNLWKNAGWQAASMSVDLKSGALES